MIRIPFTAHTWDFLNESRCGVDLCWRERLSLQMSPTCEGGGGGGGGGRTSNRNVYYIINRTVLFYCNSYEKRCIKDYLRCTKTLRVD